MSQRDMLYGLMGMSPAQLMQQQLGSLAQSGYINTQPPKLKKKMTIKRGDFLIIDPNSDYAPIVAAKETLEEAQEFVKDRLSKNIGKLIICTQLEVYESNHTVVLQSP